jgi:exodeoxyribonuclease VII large subunit
MVVARKDDFCSNIDRLTHRLGAAMTGTGRRLELRLRAVEAKPGFAGFHGRVALRGRHAAELTHELRRAMQAGIARRQRSWQSLRLALETFDLRRWLGRVRTRLVAAEGRLSAAANRRRHAADARLRGAAARLDTLSPLAVLGRGYAVCWNAERTEIVRDAGRVGVGDHVRVTLNRGELEAAVTKTRPAS